MPEPKAFAILRGLPGERGVGSGVLLHGVVRFRAQHANPLLGAADKRIQQSLVGPPGKAAVPSDPGSPAP